MLSFSSGIEQEKNTISPLGYWKTIDDETGVAKGIVQVFEKEDGKLYGRVIKILPGATKTICDECKGELKDRPIMGLEFLTNFSKSGERWKGGEILDPKTGKVYRSEMWTKQYYENEVLVVRGYWGIFYRTQTWYRFNP